MPLLATIALFGWIPVVLVLFWLLPARRAITVGSISASLLLPPTGIDLAGLPAYGKLAAATVGTVLSGDDKSKSTSGGSARRTKALVSRKAAYQEDLLSYAQMGPATEGRLGH